MIAYLKGIVSDKVGARVVIECSGVGYGVLVTAQDFELLQLNQPTKVFIYEQIKEDAHELFGFLQAETKQLFEQLLSVKNVGPKVALSVLDIGSGETVRAAISQGDVKKLQTAKGVGKRAAEQIVVELRDKMGAVVGDAVENLISRSGINQQDEALQALVSLGYTETDAVIVLQGIDQSASLEERVKQALRMKA